MTNPYLKTDGVGVVMLASAARSTRTLSFALARAFPLGASIVEKPMAAAPWFRSEAPKHIEPIEAPAWLDYSPPQPAGGSGERDANHFQADARSYRYLPWTGKSELPIHRQCNPSCEVIRYGGRIGLTGKAPGEEGDIPS